MNLKLIQIIFRYYAIFFLLDWLPPNAISNIHILFLLPKIGPVHLTILRFIMSSLLCISTNKINHFTMCSSLQLILVQGKQSSKHSVLSFMYCMVLSMKLFSIEEWLWCSMFRNLHACGYQVPHRLLKYCAFHIF